MIPGLLRRESCTESTERLLTAAPHDFISDQEKVWSKGIEREEFMPMSLYGLAYRDQESRYGVYCSHVEGDGHSDGEPPRESRKFFMCCLRCGSSITEPRRVLT